MKLWWPWVYIIQGHLSIAIFFQMGYFVVARFLLTSASCGPSAIVELLVLYACWLIVARSSSDGFAICYVLPVLWMTSCYHVTALWRVLYVFLSGDWRYFNQILLNYEDQQVISCAREGAKSAIYDCLVESGISVDAVGVDVARSVAVHGPQSLQCS